MPFDLEAHRERLRLNQLVKCKRPSCVSLRHMSWDVCEAHAKEVMERRRTAGIKASATKRLRYPHKYYTPGQRPDFRFQSFCHGAVHLAVKRGVLPDLSQGEYACADCGAPALEYDHRDYARPLDVDPVCKSCNRLRGAAKFPSADRYNFKRVAQPATGPAPSSEEAADAA
ncbi:MAG: hypothetical protein J0M00_13225 [Burkholderiales bacterium]|nr:hypothetical protein [Burkholderiales bacterium]